MSFDALSNKVIELAIDVHRELGPGLLLLESTYEAYLAYRLQSHNISFQRQPSLPVMSKEVKIDCGYRVDLLAENYLLLELKRVSQLQAIHEAQILTYMKLVNISIALLINFNVKLLTQGIKRFVL